MTLGLPCTSISHHHFGYDVLKADRMMEEHGFGFCWSSRRLLKGYVAKEDVRAALPSRATTFSKHELNYLLAKMTVKELVRTNIPTVSPETDIEVAAKIMHDQDLAGLPVVDQDGQLKGYISRGSMLSVLVEEMGLDLGGIALSSRRGSQRVSWRGEWLFFDMGVNILFHVDFFRNNQACWCSGRRRNIDTVLQAVRTMGFTIVGRIFVPRVAMM